MADLKNDGTTIKSSPLKGTNPKVPTLTIWLYIICLYLDYLNLSIYLCHIFFTSISYLYDTSSSCITSFFLCPIFYAHFSHLLEVQQQHFCRKPPMLSTESSMANPPFFFLGFKTNRGVWALGHPLHQTIFHWTHLIIIIGGSWLKPRPFWNLGPFGLEWSLRLVICDCLVFWCNPPPAHISPHPPNL